MILNEIQYECSKAVLEDFKCALKSTIAKDYANDRLKKVDLAGIECHIEKISNEIELYERLKSKQVTFKSDYFFEEIKPVLAQIRIASGKSQEDVAKEVGISIKEFRQLEDSDYDGIDRLTISNVANALGKNLVDKNTEVQRVPPRPVRSAPPLRGSLQAKSMT